MKQKIYQTFAKITGILFFFISLSNCEIQPNFEYEPSNSSKYLDMTAMEFINSHDSLTLLKQAIEITGLSSYYTNETRTFIMPYNKAFKDYIAANEYASLTDVPIPLLRNLLLYHIVDAIVSFDDPELLESDNPIAYSTENGQIMYLSHNSNFIGSINAGTSMSIDIKTSNLTPTNGVIHIVYYLAYYSATTSSTVVPDPMLDSDTIYVKQDAYVRAGTYVDDNFGAADDLTLRSDIGSSINDRKVFLKFDLSEVTTRGTLRDAYLNVGAYYAAGKGTSMNLQNVQDITWSESTITWNNMPSPDAEVFSSIGSTPIDYLEFGLFTWDCSDYIKSKLASPGEITILIDALLGTNDGIMFVSKENSTFSYPAMLVTTYSGGSSTLAMGTNTGLTVANEGIVVLDTDQLSMKGAEPSDIVYTIESIPSNGWLISGLNVLSVGTKFTQLDIDYGNIMYINDNGTADSFSVSVKDKDGGEIAPFVVNITII